MNREKDNLLLEVQALLADMQEDGMAGARKGLAQVLPDLQVQMKNRTTTELGRYSLAIFRNGFGRCGVKKQ